MHTIICISWSANPLQWPFYEHFHCNRTIINTIAFTCQEYVCAAVIAATVQTLLLSNVPLCWTSTENKTTITIPRTAQMEMSFSCAATAIAFTHWDWIHAKAKQQKWRRRSMRVCNASWWCRAVEFLFCLTPSSSCTICSDCRGAHLQSPEKDPCRVY